MATAKLNGYSGVMGVRKLPQMVYDFRCGPVSIEQLDREPVKGNCRLAVQYYFYVSHGLRFQADEILCPRSFRETGKTLELSNDGDGWIEGLRRGDVLFGERIAGKDGEKIDRSRENFSSEDLWITCLHSAIFLGKMDDGMREILPEEGACPLDRPLIWHATAIAGGTCVWTVDEFRRFYKVIAARRFLPD